MIPVETVPGVRGGRMRERSAGGEYLIHYKNLCKCYNIVTPSTEILKNMKIVMLVEVKG
jgi:hypothetical protein